MERRNTRSSSAQSIVETVVGIIFLIPIVLFLLDIAVLVMASTANDNLAKSVARAAASAKDTGSGLGTAPAGYNAATAAAGTFASSDLIKPSSGSFLVGYCWNGMGTGDTQGTSWPSSVPQPNVGNVGVVTKMSVKVPVPFPFLPDSIDFQAKAVEPVVSIPAGADVLAQQAQKSVAQTTGVNSTNNGPGSNSSTYADAANTPQSTDAQF